MTSTPLPRGEVRELLALFEERAKAEKANFDLGEVLLGSYRHKCLGRTDRPSAQAPTRAINLSEIYEVSESRAVAMIYREGRCRGCKLLARSRPLFVDPNIRPPLEGRVGRS